MGKYLNTSPSPVLYNSDGQTVDGFAWLVSDETEEILRAKERGELLEFDSEGNIIYDSIEEPELPEIDPGEPEDADK